MSLVAILQKLAAEQEAATKAAEAAKTAADAKAKSSRTEPPPGPPPGGPGMGMMPPPPAPTGMDAQSLFQSLVAHEDTDGDGLISAAEAAQSPFADLFDEVFQEIDGNSDGKISADELSDYQSRTGLDAFARATGRPAPSQDA